MDNIHIEVIKEALEQQRLSIERLKEHNKRFEIILTIMLAIIISALSFMVADFIKLLVS